MTTKELVQMAELPDYYVQLIASARNAATINTLKIKPTAHKVGWICRWGVGRCQSGNLPSANQGFNAISGVG
jgi:hypothetical protein